MSATHTSDHRQRCQGEGRAQNADESDLEKGQYMNLDAGHNLYRQHYKACMYSATWAETSYVQNINLSGNSIKNVVFLQQHKKVGMVSDYIRCQILV